MLDKTIFAQNLAVLAEVYDKTLTDKIHKIYYALLGEMEDADFKQSVRRLLQERVFATFPKPAEILSLSNVKKIEVVEIDKTEERAKELIQAVETMNTILFNECNKTGAFFDDYVRDYEFDNICDDTKAILDNVKPYCSHKQLILNIRSYQTSVDAIKAFKNAIEYSSNVSAIKNSQVRKMIRG